MPTSSDYVIRVESPAVIPILTSPTVGVNVWEVHDGDGALSSIVLKSGVPNAFSALILKVTGKWDEVKVD